MCRELRIRPYDPNRDASALRALFTELHETERRIDPRMRSTEAILEPYVAQLFERGAEWDGEILVAERREEVVGYACVYRRYVSDELDDPPDAMAYLSDLCVARSARGEGIGRALLRAVEALARDAGVATLRLSVLAGNDGARRALRG